jgi:hypothetical protein
VTSTGGTLNGLGLGFGAMTLTVNSGTTNVTGTNTFTGATTVNGGLLSVNGTSTGSAVTVNAGGTLGGNGTVGNTTMLAVTSACPTSYDARPNRRASQARGPVVIPGRLFCNAPWELDPSDTIISHCRRVACPIGENRIRPLPVSTPFWLAARCCSSSYLLRSQSWRRTRRAYALNECRICVTIRANSLVNLP